MFWSEYPWWKHLLYNTPFSSFPIDRPPVPLPSGTTLLTLQYTSPSSDLEHILPATCEFLYHHFARTIAHPRLTYTPDTLLGPHDLLLVLLQKGSYPHPVIAGTLRYHLVGTFQHTDKPVSLVDAFCIHPTWRGKGLGAFLLATLHRTANQQGRPYALFLKEGTPLPYPVRPALSGQYVYRELSPLSPLSSLPLLSLSPCQAHCWMRLYLQSFPSTFLGLPPPSPPSPPSQHWFAYASPTASILVCVQDAHQVWKGGRIGWTTVWLETPTVTPFLRYAVSNALSYVVAPYYQWLWLERRWVGEPMGPEWIEDGAFHWYSYQWATTCHTTGYAITA